MYSVRITELEKEFKDGRKIFSGLNLELEESSLTALVGASGEGKTTLLNVIGLLDMDYSVQVELFGQKANELNQTEMARLRNQQIGFILQEPLLIKNMSVKIRMLETIFCCQLYTWTNHCARVKTTTLPELHNLPIGLGSAKFLIKSRQPYQVGKNRG